MSSGDAAAAVRIREGPVTAPVWSRIDWVDTAKGIGIFLVVFGHTLRGLTSRSILPGTPQVETLDRWIYSFHMPLFFLLAGLFAARSVSKPLGTFLAEKAGTIAYPYLVWSILQGVLQRSSSDSSRSQLPLSQLWRITYAPVMQFWFLYVLFFILVVYASARKARLPESGFLFLTFIFHATGYLGVSLGPWGVLYMVRWYSIYFAVGSMVSDRDLQFRFGVLRTPVLAACAVCGYLAVVAALFVPRPEDHWLDPGVALAGIGATAALAVLLERFDEGRWIRAMGLVSLQIYVAHTIASAALRVALQKVLESTEPVTHLLLGTTAGILGPMGLYAMSRRFGFEWLFTLKKTKVRRGASAA